jgi:hypothetical protein
MNIYEYKQKLLTWGASLNLTTKLVICFTVLFNIGLLIAFQLFSFNEVVNEVCAAEYPNSFVARVQCIHRMDAQEKKDKAELELKKSKEMQSNVARGCISENIGKMESTVKALQAATDDDLTLIQLKPIFDDVMPKFVEYHGEVFSSPPETSKTLISSSGKVDWPQQKTSIVPADDNIKERVLVATITPLCETSFYLLVNVRASESEKIESFKVWAVNPPTGYHDGLHYEFTVDYAARRMAKDTEAKLKKSVSLDPCAPNLSKAERLSRLAQYGTVKQYSEFEYSAANHKVTFERFYPYGALASCY